jgi:hypothetical protein
MLLATPWVFVSMTVAGLSGDGGLDDSQVDSAQLRQHGDG